MKSSYWKHCNTGQHIGTFNALLGNTWNTLIFIPCLHVFIQSSWYYFFFVPEHHKPAVTWDLKAMLEAKCFISVALQLYKMSLLSSIPHSQLDIFAALWSCSTDCAWTQNSRSRKNPKTCSYFRIFILRHHIPIVLFNTTNVSVSQHNIYSLRTRLHVSAVNYKT